VQALKVRVALIVVMNAMTSINMDGMVLFGESFKDLNTKFNTDSRFELLFGFFFSFVL